ncbi:MAG: hypothetical protein ACFE75_02470 [Candidatus Hodarchaeota archaeon]
MAKKQFDMNLDSNYIQFRVKPGEKREIYEYAVTHGFDNISSFVKHCVFEKVRGPEEEELEESVIAVLQKELQESKEERKKLLYLVNELTPSILDIKKQLEEEDK